ncbi:TPA: ImmA/IrrE family metallo-endopeptidase [Streptococcus suis]|nr:ImmA/IrrE family metallo-endopeptidase [Streptococcus suis]HEM6237593.1 ImmA/IrrE family metallo-endopeptidase [Streptococcus suis]
MEVKVCGIPYSIIIQEHFKAYDDERNLWGYCDYERQVIYIRESLSEERKRQVLIHELTHAMLQEAGYKEQDEDLVTRFSIILHQVLAENSQLLTFPKQLL